MVLFCNPFVRFFIQKRNGYLHAVYTQLSPMKTLKLGNPRLGKLGNPRLERRPKYPGFSQGTGGRRQVSFTPVQHPEIWTAFTICGFNTLDLEPRFFNSHAPPPKRLCAALKTAFSRSTPQIRNRVFHLRFQHPEFGTRGAPFWVQHPPGVLNPASPPSSWETSEHSAQSQMALQPLDLKK